MSYKDDYPVGTKIEAYPSPAGDFPAEVIGYRYDHDLNTGARTPIVRVLVHADSGPFEDGFAPSYAPFAPQKRRRMVYITDEQHAALVDVAADLGAVGQRGPGLSSLCQMIGDLAVKDAGAVFAALHVARLYIEDDEPWDELALMFRPE